MMLNKYSGVGGGVSGSCPVLWWHLLVDTQRCDMQLRRAIDSPPGLQAPSPPLAQAACQVAASRKEALLPLPPLPHTPPPPSSPLLLPPPPTPMSARLLKHNQWAISWWGRQWEAAVGVEGVIGGRWGGGTPLSWLPPRGVRQGEIENICSGNAYGGVEL